MFKRSAKGAIIGMVVAAWPEPEGMKKFINVWTNSIPSAATQLGKAARG
jgi:hypothetical protein